MRMKKILYDLKSARKFNFFLWKNTYSNGIPVGKYSYRGINLHWNRMRTYFSIDPVS